LTLTVSFYDVMFGLIAGLAVLSFVCLATMRGQRALAWLTMALFIGAIEMQIVKLGPSFWMAASVSMLIPAAHWCFTQSVRTTLLLGPSPAWLNRTVVLLTVCSLVLLAVGANDLAQTIPFQIAALLALGDSIGSLYRARRHALDHALLGVQCLMAIMIVLRMPLLPVILGGQSPLTNFTQSEILGHILTLWAVIGPAAVALLIAKVIMAMVESYRNRAERDDLTGLLNRSAFEQMRIDSESALLVLCDIDHFKRINDRYGHPVGDRVIQKLAYMLHDAPGYAARVGGEEFALLLPNASIQEAREVADDIRRTFSETRVDGVQEDGMLSASFGIAPSPMGSALHLAFSQADIALYQAKRTGRNRVVLFSAAEHPDGSDMLVAA
jgi:diguanylate cyclase (GGDEF)-like protein